MVAVPASPNISEVEESLRSIVFDIVSPTSSRTRLYPLAIIKSFARDH